MFIGHFGVAFGLKRLAPRASMGELVAATAWADILWTLFLLLGWEHARISPGDTRWTPLDLYDYPWSHSLLLLLIWAVVLGALHKTWRHDWRGAVAIGIGVISHWVLDWATHRADMPLYPYSAKYGLGLWNSITGTVVVELAIFLAGIALYARTTRARDRWGKWGFWLYVALLLVLFIGDRFSAPPESITGIAWTGLIATVVLVGWAWWFDRHRSSGETPHMSDFARRERALQERFE
ncbi:MAG TPA: metal-dependent hydrolase [Dongiaceae bacterium]|nr:metal-dependent hydrolase [Dongiaceae bacterium]